MNSSKYEEGVCEEKWDAMVDKGLSLGSLYRWAKEDNLAEFKKIVSSSLQNFILSSMNKSHHDIAKVVYEMFKHEFKCVSNKNKTWYQFANHRWNEIDNAVELKKKISEDVVNEYCNYAHGLDPKIQELSGDPGQQELYIKGHKQHFPFHFNLGMNLLRTILLMLVQYFSTIKISMKNLIVM